MIIIECEQYSDEYWGHKLGKPSSSNFDKILTPTGKRSSQAKKYMYQLAAEQITGQRTETYTNEAMQEGIEREKESRGAYELVYGCKVEEVGVVYANEQKKALCSPDGLVDRKYGLEMKNPHAKTQVSYLLDGGVPNTYIPQIQGSLMITGFDRWDFYSHYPGLPLHIVECERDEKYISLLGEALGEFIEELDKTVKKLKELK